MTKREIFFVSLFNSILFGTLFTFATPIFNGRGIDWRTVPLELISGILIGLVISLVIPGGKLGEVLAKKLAKPGSLLFSFIMKSVILVIILIFMCPIMAVLFACVLGYAPVAVILPASYSVFLPLYLVGIVVLMLVGDLVTGAAIKCAHLGRK